MGNPNEALLGCVLFLLWGHVPRDDFIFVFFFFGLKNKKNSSNNLSFFSLFFPLLFFLFSFLFYTFFLKQSEQNTLQNKEGKRDILTKKQYKKGELKTKNIKNISFSFIINIHLYIKRKKKMSQTETIQTDSKNITNSDNSTLQQPSESLKTKKGIYIYKSVCMTK